MSNTSIHSLQARIIRTATAVVTAGGLLVGGSVAVSAEPALSVC